MPGGLLTETRLLLVRHGQTAWNRTGRWQGHADIPLDDVGLEQARALASSLGEHRIDAIYSSDLARAHQTASIIADARGLAVIVVRELREIDVGSWSGLTDEEIDSLYPGAEHHDGETPDQHRARVVAAITAIVAAHRGEHVLIVSHGHSLEAYRRHAGGAAPSRLGNCEWVAVVVG